MGVEPLSTMATSPSSSDFSDTESSVSQSHSIQSLSVGYYPSENVFSNEDAICEEKTSVRSSACFLPPAQGAWGTESLRRCFRRQDQDLPEQFCKLSIMLAWDVDVGSDHAVSLADTDLNDHNQWMDKLLEEKTKLTFCKLENLVEKLETFLKSKKDDQDEDRVFPGSAQEADFPRASSDPPHMARDCHEEHDTCQDLSPNKPPEIEDANWVLGSSPRLQEEGLAKEIGQATDRQRIPSAASSTSSDTYTIFCLNFRWAFCWLRKRLSSRWGREHPDQTKQRPSHRANRIQPQESLEG